MGNFHDSVINNCDIEKSRKMSVPGDGCYCFVFCIKVNETSIVLFLVGNDKNSLLMQTLLIKTFVSLWRKGILQDYKWIDSNEIYHSGKISGYCIEYVDFL